MELLAVSYMILVGGVLVGWPVYELLTSRQTGTRTWWAKRRAARTADSQRLLGWANVLHQMNKERLRGVLYTGRHSVGTPVTEFVVLTYSAGPRHRRWAAL